jgi:predicted metal-dependent peptidase
MAKLTAEQRIERVHMKIMQDKDLCLFSGVIMVGDVTVSDKVPTACTNGRDVIYGRAFVESLDDAELMFVVLHESMHKCYRHLAIYKHLWKQRPDLINPANDYVINLEIKDYGNLLGNVPHRPRMPVDDDGNIIGLIDERFRDMDTTKVFNILKNEIPIPREPGQGGEGEGGEGGEGGGTPQSHDEHDWEGAAELTEEEEAELKEEIEQALREGSQLVGKRGGNVSRSITEALLPKVDWKDALRDEVKEVVRGHDDSTWRRLNKKYLAIDVIMAGTESTQIGGVCIAIDTSGSIGSSELSQFLGEVKFICDEVKPSRIDLLYWDGHVAAREVYEEHNMESLVESTVVRGGGGTDPDCVPPYMQEKIITPEIMIMFTDGYFFGGSPHTSKWSTVTCPIIWCVIGNKNYTAPFGKTIHVNL